MSVISGTLGAVLGSQAQNRATQANLDMARATNEANYRMFAESRGSTGNALLPLYAGDYENTLFNAARDNDQVQRALLGSPGEQYTRYRTTSLPFTGAIAQGDQVVRDIFNDNLTSQRLGYVAPVADARVNLARSQKEAISEGLTSVQNQLAAMRARAGFSGGSSFDRNRLLTNTVAANQAAATAMGGARLANAQDVRAIQDAGQALKLQNLALPYTRAQQNIQFDLMPYNTMNQQLMASQEPFRFFNINPQAFQNSPMPLVGAQTSPWQVGLTAAGATNAQIGSALLANRQANQYAQANPNYGAIYSGIGNYGGGGGGWTQSGIGSVQDAGIADYSSYA